MGLCQTHSKVILRVIFRLLSCGHTFCQTCLINLLNNSLGKNMSLHCPTCMVKHKEIQSEKEVKNLIKNYNLLRIVEKIENRKSQINTQQSCVSEKMSKLLETQSKSQIISERGTNRSEKPNHCKLHTLPFLYYNTANNNPLCESCVKGSNIPFAPLPKIVKEVKGKVDSTLTRVTIIKHEIERLQDFLSSYQ